jgi:hypothetical protein
MFAYVFKQNSEISDELYKIDDAMVSFGKTDRLKFGM